ncbi:MAG: hypothetical protein IJ009_00165 [Clostridia bacterium]|nr:hypothetical protein [Clostridia bacterium]
MHDALRWKISIRARSPPRDYAAFFSVPAGRWKYSVTLKPTVARDMRVAVSGTADVL